ncbi:thioesterase family protein [Pseudomonas violetae]|uniref:Thioesterase family protein n=1 Tax=Pseudomonas violetae TaxID=2915813 RepID=A0ABT0F219_9PSED|nr:thioesterase family protein [Pseudomonas violetae]MCK1792043.1 thioesterase family protein [Pseudomonas violetae]
MSLYFRLFRTWLRARFKSPIQMGDTIELIMRVWPNDLDINGHMNNGRYMTITDLALIEYFTRAGFIKVALRKGWRPMLGGSIISYRRGLKPFAVYTLRFSTICWDARWNYMAFEFLQDGRTMAHGHSKGAIVGSEGFVSSTDVRNAMGLNPASPEFPASISAWVETERLMSVY